MIKRENIGSGVSGPSHDDHLCSKCASPCTPPGFPPPKPMPTLPLARDSKANFKHSITRSSTCMLIDDEDRLRYRLTSGPSSLPLSWLAFHCLDPCMAFSAVAESSVQCAARGRRANAGETGSTQHGPATCTGFIWRKGMERRE